MVLKNGVAAFDTSIGKKQYLLHTALRTMSPDQLPGIIEYSVSLISIGANLYSKVKSANKECNKVSSVIFAKGGGPAILACDNDSKYYKIPSASSDIEFCGADLDDQCFK